MVARVVWSLSGSFSSLAHKRVNLISAVDDVSMEVDGSLDRWLGKKPEKRGVTLLVTVSTFKMPGPRKEGEVES